MTYKMVFSDIDGTLVNSQHRLTPATIQAAQFVVSKGIPFILGSGRQPSSVREINQELGIKMPVIGFSGALIWDENDNKVWESGLTKDLAIEVKHQIKAEFPDLCCSTYSDRLWIVDDANLPSLRFEQSVTHAPMTEGSPAELLPDNAVVHKVLCTGDADVLDKVQAHFAPLYPMCRIYKSQPTYLEVMNISASKSAAAAVLCERFGITARDVIAFGDNYNDVDMLKFAGMGVAMGNAPADVKQIADKIADTNDNDGLAAVLMQEFG